MTAQVYEEMKNILMVLLVRLQIGYSSAIMRVYLL